MSQFSIFAPFSTAPADQAFGDLSGYINKGVNTASPFYQSGIQAVQQYGGQALAPLQQNFGAATGGVNAYGNAVGANGPAGTQAALKAFQASPQFMEQMRAALAGSNAADAAAGRTGSGNATLSAEQIASNLAGTGWQNYVSSLSPYLNMAQNTGGQIANTNMGIGQGVQGGYNTLGNLNYGANATIGQGAVADRLAQYQVGANQVNALGALGGGLLGFLSDARVKEDIEPVGALADGQTIYRYKYAGDPRHQIGLIAQEVEDATPDAVFDAIGDLKGVDYRRATERAAKILEFNRAPYDSPPTLRPFASELLEWAA